MNLVRTISPNLASGRTSRFSAARRRDMCSSPRLLRTLRAVLRTALLAVLDALRIEGAANDVIAHAGQVLDATAADHDHRMFLQVMAFARDVAHHLVAVGEAHLGDLAQRRVGLLRRGRVDAGAYAALLRAGFERRHLVARGEAVALLADQLVDGRHSTSGFLFAVSGPPLSGIGAKRMHGHSGKSAAPARKKLCGQDGLTCSGPRRQAASRLAPTTSPPARWRAYMAAAVRRQACCGALLIDIVGYSGPSPSDSFLTDRGEAAQESINHI